MGMRPGGAPFDRIWRVFCKQHSAEHADDRAGMGLKVSVVNPVTARRRVRLLNVDVDDITMDELVEKFREGLLLTLHVDMIMKLQQDREFYQILPHFDIVTCDSQILIGAAKLL